MTERRKLPRTVVLLGVVSFLNDFAYVNESLLWLLDRADLSVLLILLGFFITKFFTDSR